MEEHIYPAAPSDLNAKYEAAIRSKLDALLRTHHYSQIQFCEMLRERGLALEQGNLSSMLKGRKRIPLSLDLEVEGRPYKLAHGAPPEAWDGEERYKNPTYFAVWKRLEAQETLDGDYTLIFGHTPTRYLQEGAPMHVWYGDGRICIDCGSGYPESGENSGLGRLACLRLEDGQVFYSEEDYPEGE